jgi:ribosomal protein S18 acetylase RimI-like enzyme
MSAPSTEAEWLALVRDAQPPFWKLTAEASGGFVDEDGDVIAAMVPAAPERSVFNSVFYRSPERLIVAIDRLAAAYAEAGVRAWTVWVPEADVEVAHALESAGHALDAAPRAMAMTLDELVEPPPPGGGLEISQENDHGTMARVNEVAYGYTDGSFSEVIRQPVPDSYIYLARLDGEPVGCVMAWDHGEDTEITWVATLPEARGRGVSTQLMAAALRDARERGIETSTLQSTELGYRVYAAVGYRDFGALQMWERRTG